MTKRNPSSSYAHRILAAVSRAQQRENSTPYPVDMGEITKVGEDESDIVIDLYNSLMDLNGEEVQWMVDEDRLRVGDVVTVVFDRVGDPVVVAAVMQADLNEGLEAPEASGVTASHAHRVETRVPTVAQTVFQMATGFDQVAVYVNGLRLAPDLQYSVQSPRVTLGSAAAASSILVFDMQIDG